MKTKEEMKAKADEIIHKLENWSYADAEVLLYNLLKSLAITQHIKKEELIKNEM